MFVSVRQGRRYFKTGSRPSAGGQRRRYPSSARFSEPPSRQTTFCASSTSTGSSARGRAAPLQTLIYAVCHFSKISNAECRMSNFEVRSVPSTFKIQHLLGNGVVFASFFTMKNMKSKKGQRTRLSMPFKLFMVLFDNYSAVQVARCRRRASTRRVPVPNNSSPVGSGMTSYVRTTLP